MNSYSDDEPMFLTISQELSEKLAILAGKLNNALPSYMVPSLFIPCSYMPFVTSTKLDRNKLKSETARLDQEKLSMYSLQNAVHRSPETDMEKRLQSIWANVLHIPIDSIGRDDSFLRIGGDSISAIQLMHIAPGPGYYCYRQSHFP